MVLLRCEVQEVRPRGEDVGRRPLGMRLEAAGAGL
jgi:hypothetical protein